MRQERRLLDVLDEGVLVLDGAMGTMLQREARRLPPGLENCSEAFVIHAPDVVRAVHRAYLEAGARAVETDTFGASPLTLAEFGLAERAEEINRRAAELAREAADGLDGPPRFVLGSIGPGTRLPSLGQVAFGDLVAAYRRQVRGLLDGGVDALLVETSQDLLQAKAAVCAAREVFEERGLRVPVVVQVTIERNGTMLAGSDVSAAHAVLDGMDGVDVLGLNCATGPREMAPHVRALCRASRLPVSVLPNAGLPELVGGRARYPLEPAELADWHERFVREDGVSIVGGCCGTTPAHIRAVAERVAGLRPARREPAFVPALASLYSAVPMRQDADVLAVGERTNANGSRRFRRLLEAEDWDGIVAMARRQVRAGSHAIDVCTAVVGRDERRDMEEVVGRLRTAVDAPLVIDSTEFEVVEAALELIGGRPVINSTHLEEGEERCRRTARLARRHHAALVALTIDERGMARTPERKLEVAERLYRILVEEEGLEPHDLWFDPLTFTICTGNEEDRRLALWTLEALEALAERYPRSGILLGVSNVSFGLAPRARHVLNSVMLYHARKRGLTAAIVHASKVVPLHRVDPELREAADDLLFDRRRGGVDPLQRYLALFEERGEAAAAAGPALSDLPLEERLRRRIVEGERSGLEDDLRAALDAGMDPLGIINEVLLEGMREVGELFGSGQMQLPFVLQSAETMKAAVAFLEPHLARGESARSKGRIVLATVRGDVHDIGKNLVDILLSNNGFEVVNLGIKQPVEAILRAVEEHRPDAVGMSGLLVRSTAIMRENLEEMRRQGVTVPVVLGGAALTRSFVERECSRAYGRPVAYAPDAFAGLRFMEELHRARAEGRRTRWELPLEEAREGEGEAGERPSPPPRGARPLPDELVDAGPVERVEPPVPPFWGAAVEAEVRLAEVRPYLDERVLFRFQWGYRRRGMDPAAYEEQLRTVVRPLLAELLERVDREGIVRLRAVRGYFPCRREGDAIIVEHDGGTVRLAFPRQRGRDGRPGRCIADWFRADRDVVAFMVVTAGERASEEARRLFEAGRYRDYLHLHGLAVELTEALAERTHRLVREELGIAGDDGPTPEDLLRARYRGRRFAYGYPACPDLEDQRHLLRLLGAERIGVRMDPDLQLHPEQSTAAIVVHHPAARYFRA